jgi:hypothetical protein
LFEQFWEGKKSFAAVSIELSESFAAVSIEHSESMSKQLSFEKHFSVI